MNQSIEVVTCRACGGNNAKDWLHPREMMFGLREVFSYFRCGDCGCLQLMTLPDKMEPYYPEGYYSYEVMSGLSPSLGSRLKRKWIYPAMTKSKLGWPGAWGSWLRSLGTGPVLPHWFPYLKGPIPLGLSILDVGCGSGELLLGLRNCGFKNVLGVDPYVSSSIVYDGGIEVRKCQLKEVEGRFGLIMFHHVFEHVEDPKQTLLEAKNLLQKGGQILIRIPVSDSAACEKYRENWVQLDAPRHITLQTRDSMEVLARQLGLRIENVVYDSTALQFWGSEQYCNDIPLMDSRSNSTHPDELKVFNDEAVRLNELGRGDQAAFVLVVDS